jgi:oligopeptide transport system ATP-binding protein
MSALLEVTGLVKRFGPVRAVDGVSFSLDPGETLALVGESGCGKSTTGRCLLRLIEPDAGAVRFEGADILDLRGRRLQELRQKLQIVFQDPLAALNPRLTAGQAIGEPLYVHGICRRADVRQRVAELLAVVGMSADHAGHYPHQLSGGQRQRVVIARALALKPRLIVADEPVSALDVSVQAQVLSLLLDLQERLGVAYLFISHNLGVVRHIARRTAVMYLGRIVEVGPTAELFARPRHPYTQALLAAVPRLDPAGARRPLPLVGETPSARRLPSGCRFQPRCPVAVPECKEIEPLLRDCAEGHQAACHLASEPVR